MDKVEGAGGSRADGPLMVPDTDLLALVRCIKTICDREDLTAISHVRAGTGEESGCGTPGNWPAILSRPRSEQDVGSRRGAGMRLAGKRRTDMRVIYKYLCHSPPNTASGYKLPKGAQIIGFGVQASVPVFWAIVDTEQPEEERGLAVMATGEVLPLKPAERHLGTAQDHETGLVWHLFEVPYA
jgi:hypothetical protein